MLEHDSAGLTLDRYRHLYGSGVEASEWPSTPSSLAIVIKRGHSKYPSYAFHLWSLGDSNP